MTTRPTSAQTGPPERRWSGQDTGAQALRIAIAILPTILATITVLVLIRMVPSTGSVAARLTWILWVAAAGFVVASLTTRFAVRLLPLAALMKLSLVFPDQAPSRLKLAIRAASSRHLKAQVDSARHHGLSSDTTEAAGQVLLLTAALGEHDRRTRGHSERVRLYARLLGEELGIGGDDLERLQWGALLHDVGKLTIPTEILNKPGALGPAEKAIMSGHAAAGSELVEPLHPFLGPFVAAADGHHERWDGSGYPLGLQGEAIPIAARIVAVADAYEVMTAIRPYKKAMSPAAARAELTACAGTHFDPGVVRAWLRLSVGDVNKAAGPLAVLAAIPLIGEVVSLFARTASQLATVPAAAATLAPAAATAGAMTVAMVAAPPPPVGPADLSLNLSASTTTAQVETTAVPQNVTPSTLDSTTATDPVDSPPTTVAGTTQAPPSTSQAPPSTSQASPSTSQASTEETIARGPLSTDEILSVIRGADVSIAGPLLPGTDLSLSGPYGAGRHLFMNPAQTLTTDLDAGGVMIPAGTTVCVHLVIASESNDDRPWFIDYGTEVLTLATTADQLTATDWLSPPDVNYGSEDERGLDDDDDAKIIRNGTRVRLRFEGGNVDSTRILLDCSP